MGSSAALVVIQGHFSTKGVETLESSELNLYKEKVEALSKSNVCDVYVVWWNRVGKTRRTGGFSFRIDVRVILPQ